MESSLPQIFFVIFLIFPALLMLGTFRCYYPKSRFIQVSNFFLLLPMVMAVFFIGFDLIAYALNIIFVNDSGDIKNFFKNSILFIVLEIHIRSLLFVIFLSNIHNGLEWLNDCLEEKRRDKSRVKKRKRPIEQPGWLERKLFQLNNVISHPWIAHIRHNRKTEILMADVLTEDDNLYTGRFEDFTASGNEISSVSLGNIFRYYPSTGEKATERSPDGGGYTSKRKHRLIKNSGELFIPYSKIKTIHLWNLEINTIIDINIYDTNGEELFKWYLTLMRDAPHIFKQLNVNLFLAGADKNDFQKRLSLWINSYKISKKNILKINIVLQHC